MESSQNINFFEVLFPLLLIVFIIAVGVVLLTQQFRKNIYLQKLKQEELKNSHQTEILRHSIEVQERERKRVALDLHDELGAALSITKMHLLQAEKLHGHLSATLLEDLKNITHLTEISLTSMRRISHELMPPQLETFGLVKTLESVAEQLNKTSKVSLEINVQPSMPELKWAISLAFYRIFMELINNTLKHSGASKISIDLFGNSNIISANYDDNGTGIAAEGFGNGMGLKSIEGRVNSLGGSLIYGISKQGGFSVSLTIPFAN
jgi:signal transduction histidine kinase